MILAFDLAVQRRDCGYAHHARTCPTYRVGAGRLSPRKVLREKSGALCFLALCAIRPSGFDLTRTSDTACCCRGLLPLTPAQGLRAGW